MNTAAQPDLFPVIWERRCNSNPPTIQQRFERFHSQNPEVFALFCRIARSYARQGRRYVSAKGIFEQIRVKVNTTDGETFKLDNSFTSRYVRLYLEFNPSRKDLFETRELKAE